MFLFCGEIMTLCIFDRFLDISYISTFVSFRDANIGCFLVSFEDVSPTGQGVDHRQVQRELGEMAVQLHEPVLLTASSVKISWNVSAFDICPPNQLLIGLMIHLPARLISFLCLALPLSIC